MYTCTVSKRQVQVSRPPVIENILLDVGLDMGRPITTLLDQRSWNDMTQTIDTKTVRHVAFLVRLGISEEEAHTFSRQFSSIIDYFNMLNEVDTMNVPPASDIANAENVLREDVVQPSMSREEFLKNAPESERGYVKVPTVLGDE
jgi:aspartyl-tRNA(Asn)/glutamyl-tRNA(Gln) amidotransferase subunit C